jgi:hypothetical protein
VLDLYGKALSGTVQFLVPGYLHRAPDLSGKALYTNLTQVPPIGGPGSLDGRKAPIQGRAVPLATKWQSPKEGLECNVNFLAGAPCKIQRTKR